MSKESRDKEEVYEFFSRSGTFFSLAGCVFLIFAFLLPMIQVDWYIELGDFWEFHRFWIFGWEEIRGLDRVIEWFGTNEEAKLGVALISIGSTVVISISVLGTILSATYSFVRKRKKGVYSSRVALFCSMGVFGALQAYMWLMPFYIYIIEPPEFLEMTFQIGPFLFTVGSLLILLGYTANIVPLLKLFSLYLASSLILYGGMELIYFFSYLITWEAIPPIPLDSVFHRVVPASIALFSALLIVLINYILHRKTKKEKIKKSANKDEVFRKVEKVLFDYIEKNKGKAFTAKALYKRCIEGTLLDVSIMETEKILYDLHLLGNVRLDIKENINYYMTF